jgi:hypothetical protein
MTTTITGTPAIYIAYTTGSKLASYNNPVDDACDDLDVETARRIIREDRSLVYTTVDLADIRERVESLMAEARAAGDTEASDLCQEALDGVEEALVLVVVMLADAWGYRA